MMVTLTQRTDIPGIARWAFVIGGCCLLSIGSAATANPQTDGDVNGSILMPPGAIDATNDLSIIENGLILSNDHASNMVRATGATARGTTNRTFITLSGTGNGGLGQGWPEAALITDFAPTGGGFAPASLTPGEFVQDGINNLMTVSLEGSANLAAAYQSGSDNRLTASVSGTNNISAVYQSGDANLTAYSQTGGNNILGISQTSW